MKRWLGPAPVALAALTVSAYGQARPPAQKTGPITIYGSGSTGDLTLGQAQASGNGTVLRSFGDQGADALKAASYGVKCDGATDNTAAFNKAFADAKARTLVLPAGVCLTGPLAYAPSPSRPITIQGEGKDATVLKLRAPADASVLTVGAAPSTGPYYDIRVQGMTIDGADKTITRSAFTGYDLWRVTLRDVLLTNAKIGSDCYGCIWYYFDGASAFHNQTGLRFRYLANSYFGNTPPNLVQIQSSQINENTIKAIDFDDGAMMSIRGSNIEYNGTTPGAAGQGGVFIGANVGRFMVGTVTPGAQILDTWFEGNKGEADISQLSGRGSYRNILNWANPTDTTNDIKVLGGSYVVDNFVNASKKTPNLLEGPNVIAGNVIQASLSLVSTVDRSKTNVIKPLAQGVRLRLSPQSVPNDTQFALTWGVSEYDTGYFQFNPNIVCIQDNVDRVRVTAGFGFATNGTNIRRMRIMKNAQEVASSASPGLGFNFLNADTGVIAVTKGDCFEVDAYQNTGSPLAVLTGQSDFFAMEVVR